MHGVGKIMKKIWVTNVQQKRKQFFDDQSKNSTYVCRNVILMVTMLLFHIAGSGARGNRFNHN